MSQVLATCNGCGKQEKIPENVIKNKNVWVCNCGKRNEPTSFLFEPILEFTGGSSSYYLVSITNPTTPGVEPYQAECNDIIEALGMNYAEGNAFKAIWRSCAARQGKRKKGYDEGLYDAEKVEFFGKRMVELAKQKQPF